MYKMKKINIVYDWIGPMGPISNARMPTVYDLALAMEDVRVMDNKRITSAYLYKNILNKFPDNFTLKPASEVTREDLFIYDFQYIYKTTAESLFVFGVPTGLFENAKVSSKVIDCIINGNGYFLLDFSMESFVYNNFFQIIENYFVSHNIPLNKVIYMTGCPNGEELYKQFCIERGKPPVQMLKVLSWDAFEWNMSHECMNDTYAVDRNIDNINKTFLSLNYRYRPHRMDLLLAFYKNGLLDSSLFTFPAISPESNQMFINVVDRSMTSRLNITEEELQYIQQTILPLKIDAIASDHRRHGEMTMEHGRSMERFYKSTLMSVVTETHAYQYAIAETEKTFKPIKYKHPFILVGATNSLKYLKNKGYKTFSNWFSEDYDEIDNHRDRIIHISNLCKEIDGWDRDTKSKFIIETEEVVNHNFELFKSVHKTFPNFNKLFE